MDIDKKVVGVFVRFVRTSPDKGNFGSTLQSF
jgi:hypothetical protein